MIKVARTVEIAGIDKYTQSVRKAIGVTKNFKASLDKLGNSKKFRIEMKASNAEINKLKKNVTVLAKNLNKAKKDINSSAKSIKSLGDKSKESKAKIEELIKRIEQLKGKLNKSKGAFNNFKGLSALALRLGGLGSAVYAAQKLISSTAKTVIDFDKQIIGVAKTTNLSENELALFRTQVVDLGKSLKGVSTQGLVETAEVAGQMGIRGRENILAFSAAIEKLKLTSDIVGGDSVRSFAKFIEISGSGAQSAETLASVLTVLGNNFATTESQILHNSTEIQKGIALYNVSAASILGLGAATESLGIQAEQSRSAMQKTFKVLNNAISTGEGLQQILQLTGYTQEQLSAQFNKDANVVFLRFLKGLDSLKKEGGNLVQTLGSLDLAEKRTEAVLGAMSKRYDLVAKAAGYAAEEIGKTGAIQEEYERATESLSSKLGDVADAWRNFTLGLEDGSGRFSKAAGAVLRLVELALNAADGSTIFDEKFLLRATESEKVADKWFNSIKNGADASKAYDGFFNAIRSLDETHGTDGLFSMEHAAAEVEKLKQRVAEFNQEADKAENAKIAAADAASVDSINNLKVKIADLTKVRDKAKIGSEEFKEAEAELYKLQDRLAKLQERVKPKDFESGSLAALQDKLKKINEDISKRGLREDELTKKLLEKLAVEKELNEVIEQRSKLQNQIKESQREDDFKGTLPTLGITGVTRDPKAAKKEADEFKKQADERLEARRKYDEKEAELLRKKIEDGRKIAESGLSRYFSDSLGINVNFDGLFEAIEAGGEDLARKGIAIGAQIAQGISNSAFDQQVKRIEEAKQFELDTLQERYASRIEAAKGNAAVEAQIQEELDRKREQIEKRAAQRQNDVKVKQAIANGLLAITQALANNALSFPLSLVSTAIIAATTAAQVAQLKSVKFAEGGRIDSDGIIQGPSHSRGGVKMRINGRSIEAEGGEAIDRDENGSVHIFSRRDTANNRELLARLRNAGTYKGKSADLNAVRSGGSPLMPKARRGIVVNGGVSGIDSAIERSMAKMIPHLAQAVRDGAESGSGAGIRISSKDRAREEKLETYRTL